MIKPPPFAESLLPALSALVPELRVLIASSTLIRGDTAKGRYDIRLSDDGRELRTIFLARGRNPLKQSELLLRAAIDAPEGVQIHAIAVRENEHKLPWIHRERDSDLGDQIVKVKPFGDDPNAPMVSVRTSALTGFISLEVINGREMSPPEARLVAKALAKASKLAAASKMKTAKIAVAA